MTQASSIRTKIAALMGSAAAASALLGGLTLWEGKRNVGYLDIAKVPTACMGDTQNVVVGKYYSDAECEARLERQALTHLEGVLKCTPRLKGRPYQLQAAGSLAYNIGVGAYCGSTAAKRFQAGNWGGGCSALLLWDKARVGGKLQTVQGLANRRQWEYKVCMKGVA
ncbi:MAG: lysozyme [Sphingobium sp.]